jgi:SPP1 gp7 family putative phage head morphogenesis protein
MRWTGVDLDNTLAAPTAAPGWRIGPPNPIMLKRVLDLIDQGKVVKIFTARACDPAQIPVVKQWLKENGLPDLEVTNAKDYNTDQIWDDRARQVSRTTGDLVEEAQVPGKTEQDKAKLKVEIAVMMGNQDSMPQVYGEDPSKVVAVPLADTKQQIVKEAKAEKNLDELNKARKEGVDPENKLYKYVSHADARPEHKALNGKVFKAEDLPIKSVTPPADKNCRCKVVPVAAAGKPVTKKVQDDYYHQKAMSDTIALADEATEAADLSKFIIEQAGIAAGKKELLKVAKDKDKPALASSIKEIEKEVSEAERKLKALERAANVRSPALQAIAKAKEQANVSIGRLSKEMAQLPVVDKNSEAGKSIIEEWTALNTKTDATANDYVSLTQKSEQTRGPIIKALQEDKKKRDAEDKKIVEDGKQKAKIDASKEKAEASIASYKAATAASKLEMLLNPKIGGKLTQMTGETVDTVMAGITGLLPYQKTEILNKIKAGKVVPSDISTSVSKYQLFNKKIKEYASGVAGVEEVTKGDLPAALYKTAISRAEADPAKKDEILQGITSKFVNDSQFALDKAREAVVKAKDRYGYDVSEEQWNKIINERHGQILRKSELSDNLRSIKDRIATLETTAAKSGGQKGKDAALTALRSERDGVLRSISTTGGLQSSDELAYQSARKGSRDAAVSGLQAAGLTLAQATEARQLGMDDPKKYLAFKSSDPQAYANYVNASEAKQEPETQVAVVDPLKAAKDSLKLSVADLSGTLDANKIANFNSRIDEAGDEGTLSLIAEEVAALAKKSSDEVSATEDENNNQDTTETTNG